MTLQQETATTGLSLLKIINAVGLESQPGCHGVSSCLSVFACQLSQMQDQRQYRRNAYHILTSAA